MSWHAPTGRWLAAGHAAVEAVLRDRRLGRFWHDREPAEVYEPFNLLHRNQMMENEPPAHTRLRSLVAKAFGRGHVERLRPAVAAEAAALLAAASPEFDLLTDVAEPLTVTVIAELLGVPVAGCTSASAPRWPASSCRPPWPPSWTTHPPWPWRPTRFPAPLSSCAPTGRSR